MARGISESVSAFANTDGGVIILGLDESAGFASVPDLDVPALVNGLRVGLSRALGESPKVQPVPDYELARGSVDDHDVLVLTIHPLRAEPGIAMPCFVYDQGVERGSYRRADDADVRLTPYEGYLLRTQNQMDSTDREVVPGATLADLSKESVARTLDVLRAGRSHALEGIAPDDVAAALARINVLTRDGEVTLAGYLALGAYPQQEYPQLTVDVAVHPGLDTSQDPSIRFIDRQNCDGPLPRMIQDAVAAVLRNLRVHRVVDGTGGRDVAELPEEVLREAITNAVMHRDYSHWVRGQQVAVDVYPDWVEVSSPGGFWGDKTKDNVADGRSQARNQVLVRLLSLVPLDGHSTVAEQQGSGVLRMVVAMRQQGLDAPDYSASTVDHVVVRLDRFGSLAPQADAGPNELPDAAGRRSAMRVISEARREILRVLRTDEPRSIHEVSEMTGRSVGYVRPLLRDLVERGLVEATAPPQSRRRKYLIAH
ncbi:MULTISPECIES: ATP-binding protein [Actinomyces]|uniref:Putative DNA binding domain-containing protein n=1 Tax=Actinomyces respiraculi TaxID=2744574 RepID=A0A7T0PVP2_9ACTO|nr:MULTISPECIES: ATP-binding protein [Actinomyces]QPL05496.1 putative DNA binding domain-containing protein [Actinomyces respiraculi]